MILADRKERTRFLRFAVVGSIGAIVDFGVFNLLSGPLKTPAVIASMISFTFAVISNFTWNRFWTYPDSRSKALYRQIVQFFLINLIGLAIRTPMFAGLEKLLTNLFTSIVPAEFYFSPVFIAHNISLATVILIVMLWNFFANRYWTYNDVK